MIRGLLTLTLLIFLINVLYIFTAPYVKNTMLDGKMTELSKNRGNKSEAEVRAELLKFIYDKSIDLDAANLMVESTGSGLLVAARYETRVSFWNYSRRYAFFPASDERARLYWNQRQRRY